MTYPIRSGLKPITVPDLPPRIQEPRVPTEVPAADLQRVKFYLQLVPADERSWARDGIGHCYPKITRGEGDQREIVCKLYQSSPEVRTGDKRFLACLILAEFLLDDRRKTTPDFRHITNALERKLGGPWKYRPPVSFLSALLSRSDLTVCEDGNIGDWFLIEVPNLGESSIWEWNSNLPRG